ncbi:hypothetical protein BOTBODRAFT_32952 [Botryobasidium botryosum FD-172 SS1]|uniref:Protein kinase domain-containing protein n=1 Tax=Botryobasidium botryosum (strain FD-172 SS1) TaxID=930990 RepID=A0A067MQK0_BOTB1|nr:hypothetical protein BOTBODRAFT_32952 [Botryobasidium botryosum FD-172 SS1]
MPFDYDFVIVLAAEIMRHRDGVDLIDIMLDMGCDTSRPNRAGVTLRQFALSTNSLPLIRTVLKRERDPLDSSIREKMSQLREQYLALPLSPGATELLELLSHLYSLTGHYPSIVLDRHEISLAPRGAPAGEGGFGECWEGIFLGNRYVAMKCTHGFVLPETAMRRTLREMEMWKTLHHPNILPFIGSVTLDSKLYLVSPWMSNGNAAEYINRHPDVNRVAILLQVARGLRYLHARTPPVVHGDIKAANVLISQNGGVRIADFGLSRWAINGSSNGNSDTWRSAGNPRWQAPELLEDSDDGEIPRRTTESDIFAFGRFMIEIYTGELPFPYLSDLRVIVTLVKGTLLPDRPMEPEVVSRGLNDNAWLIIMDCCREEPFRRLTVQELILRLKSL